jgi:DNA repair protein RecN (Recombination protein N)
MLTHLSIQNIGLIEKQELDFSAGLTTLTGETGAGKSMLMDALSLALGERADFGLIASGHEKAEVTAVFTKLPDSVMTLLAEMGVEAEGELILRRQLKGDKSSSAWANGVRVTQSQLQSLGEFLLDLHGQHDSTRLLSSAAHLDILDMFAGHPKQLVALKASHASYLQAQKDLEAARTRITNREQEQELLTAYVTELESLAPKTGEENTLMQERSMLMAAESMGSALSDASGVLGDAAVPALSQADTLLSGVSGVEGEEWETLIERMSSLHAEADDVMRDLSRLAERSEPNPARLEEVDDRLHALRSLARKHRVEVKDLEDLLPKLQSDLDGLETLGQDIASLEQRVEKTFDAFEDQCRKRSTIRGVSGQKLSAEVEHSLQDLNMKGSRFAVELERMDSAQWNAKGSDKVTFVLSTAPQSPMQPLSKVASGGEMSRLMLALKKVFYANLPSMTLILDEIDTGIGGATADKVGDAMKQMGGQHQILTITHQPQAASKADTHLYIEKSDATGRMVTSVRALNQKERIDELARMLSGAEITSEAKKAAEKLLSAG